MIVRYGLIVWFDKKVHNVCIICIACMHASMHYAQCIQQQHRREDSQMNSMIKCVYIVPPAFPGASREPLGYYERDLLVSKEEETNAQNKMSICQFSRRMVTHPDWKLNENDGLVF